MAFNSIQNSYDNVREAFISLGFDEWTDAFNIENIPNSRINKAFHMNISSITPANNDFSSLTLDSSLVVNWFLKGYRTPFDAKQESTKLIEQIIVKLCNVQNRTANGVANIILSNILPQEIDISNDNIVLVEMAFTIKTVLDLQQEC